MRQLQPEDADRLAELENVLFPDNSMNETTLRTELALGHGWGEGDPLHGYVLVRSDTGMLDITRLGVLPDRRRLGTGEALFLKAIEGATKVMLCVRKSNAHALRLYMKHGFRVVGATELSWAMVRFP